jgi:TRAP transporter 4TM/12TM fusion protein
MTLITAALQRVYFGFLLVGGLAWAIDLPRHVGYPIIAVEWLGPYLAVAVAAAFLQHPYRDRAGAIEIVAGLAAIASWLWMSVNYEEWLIDFAGATPDKYLPGVIAIATMMEALRKSAGLPIMLLILALIAYGLFGSALPGPFQASPIAPESLVMYLYADTNAIPGLVLVIIASIVIAFIVLGKLMEVSGATQFFTDLAMAFMGHRRGGPAKVAVVASSLFGSISGSPVGNIMSTGVVTIPLMKATGFKAHQAAAIEAVASTGGQIAPPVMGATVFVIAEFLQISYFEVVIAALLPAFFYYFCLFVQVDGLARRHGLVGLPRADLPRAGAVVKKGWLFIAPLFILVYMLFWQGSSPASAALWAAGPLLAFALVKGRMRSRAEWGEFVFGGGASIVPLVLIGGGAGVVVGVMNVTGLGQSLSFILVQTGSAWGLFPMLVLTAALSIVLGMGMPTTAIYVVLSIVIAPALVQMGVSVMGAHLFIFYFGVMSFLTPPVAVSSYVAAGVANTGMWSTGWMGMRLSAVAYVLPFLWAYDPALLLDGSYLAIGLIIITTAVSVWMLPTADILLRSGAWVGFAQGALVLALLALIMVSPILIGPESPLALALAAVGAAVGYYFSAREPRPVARESSTGALGEQAQHKG